MIMRYLLAVAATAVVLGASGARAADMPESAPPVVVVPDNSTVSCRLLAGRQPDHVWQPGQVAYIVAQSCGGTAATSLSDWLHRITMVPRRENVLVYYNGGSTNRTDIRSINVPYQPQLH